MRAKQLISWIPVPDKVKLVYARLTLNKLTTIYFIIAVLHCIIQVVLQLAAHAINISARHLMSHILTEARLAMSKFALIETIRHSPSDPKTDLTLTLCKGIPGQFGLAGEDVCNVLWSQSRGLVNETVEGFLSPGSSTGNNSPGSNQGTKTGSASTSSAAIALPLISSSTSSSATVATSTPVSAAPTTSAPAVTSTTKSSAPPTSILVVTTTSVSTTTASPPSPTNNVKRPKQEPESDSSDDEDQPKSSRLFRRELKKSAGVGLKEERRVFSREKLRPLPRVATPLSDIDETHPEIEVHSRYARDMAVHVRRTEPSIRFVPIASKRDTSVKRSVSEQDLSDVTITPFFVDREGDGKPGVRDPNEVLSGVKITGLVGPGLGKSNNLVATGNSAIYGDVELTPGCVLALSWPAQVLRDFSREDLVMIGFQMWLLGMTIVAILNESVPHLVAGLFTQTLSTGWSGFQMARSALFREQYETTIVHGACSGVDVLPDYFSHRTEDEIPIVVVNVIFLLTTTVLTWRLCKVYGWQTFKRIGASQVMNQAYRLVLALSILLQLAVFFFLTSSALWVDELLNGSIAYFAEHRPVYEGVFITSVLLFLPWLVLGWIGVRKENKLMMHGFLFISLLFVSAWAGMFASEVYRWTFATWPFFAAMTVVSFVVLILTTGLAVVCRYNFKKGLATFLQSQQPLPGADFTNVIEARDSKTVEFPTHRPGEELPTFSVAFGRGGQPVPPSQMFPAPPAPALTRKASTRSQEDLPASYSVNPFIAAGEDFWGNETGRTTNTNTNSSNPFQTTQLSQTTVSKYSLTDSPASTRELPQWQEVRRSQLPSSGYGDLQPDEDGAEPSGEVEVLRDGRWVQVDARELYAGNSEPAPRQDSPRAPPVSRGYLDPPVVPAPRGFVGLPGKNIKPQKATEE